jgi:RND superfamily putative drug exporter
MIFRFLGQLVCRAWAPLLIVWGVLLAGTWVLAPPWEQVTQDRQFAFLPPDSPSRQAEQVHAKAYPEEHVGSSIVVVLVDQQQEDIERVRKFIQDVVEPGLRKIAQAEGGLASQPKPSEGDLFGGDNQPPPPPQQLPVISRIRTPNAPGAGALLVSPDNRALLVVMELTTELLDHRNWPIIDRVENFVRDLQQQGNVPPGLALTVTGSAVMGRDHSLAEYQSARATTFLTVVLVIGLLIVIYRAPLLAIIPLLTVYIASQIAIHLLAILAGRGTITLFSGLQIYITILTFGAGVDYCLFLTARYKEELDRGDQPAEAVTNAVQSVGAALVASAATVICGIAMMSFAQFGKFREAGFAIPLSLVLVLCATLTFSPSVLRLAGRWTFWPWHQPRPRAQGGSELERIWDRVGHHLLRRPGLVWVATFLVLAPWAAIAGLFYEHISYDLIGELPPKAPSVRGTKLLQEHFPPGVIGPVTVLLVDPNVDFGSPQGRQIVGTVIDRLRQQQEELDLADIRSLTAPLGITEAAAHAFAGSDVPASIRQSAIEREALDTYTTSLGEGRRTGTRFDLVLSQSPFARRSMDDLDRIKRAIDNALPEPARPEAQLYFLGITASMRDLATVLQADRNRIQTLVLVAVLLILILLLRRVVVPLYLLLSVLFSYYVAMGVSFVVFWLLDRQGFHGLDWLVPIFLFTILIAVGEDYNIFLITRVDEEQRRHGPVAGVTEALVRTGPIISSCGLIMAGTFASLMGGSLTEMIQLGFALSFGVLLDTFVVRPILVPSFLILLHDGRLRLGGRLGKLHHASAPAPRPQQTDAAHLAPGTPGERGRG